MYSLILHGKRSFEIQKRRSFRFAVDFFQTGSAFTTTTNSFSSPSQALPKGKTFTVSYLVDSLGLTRKLAESISRSITLEDRNNPDSVLGLLRTYGFTNSQISTIVRQYPPLLTEDAEKSLAPKLHALKSRGASTSELTKIVSKVPKIFAKKGDKTICLYYDSVKCIIEAKNKSSLFEKLSQASNLGNKVRNVLVLGGLGMPQELLLPLLIAKYQPVCGKENFDASLKKVVEMGFDPTTSKFVLALRMLYQMSEKTIQDKVEVYKSVGFTEQEIWETFKTTPSFMKVSKNKILKSMETMVGLGFSKDEFARMVKRYPACIEYSTESVRKKTEFLVKEMNWPVKAVVSHPQVVGYSLEKRIIPRCNVIKALMSKGLLSELPPVSSVLSRTDELFLSMFVIRYEEIVPELMAILKRKRAAS